MAKTRRSTQSQRNPIRRHQGNASHRRTVRIGDNPVFISNGATLTSDVYGKIDTNAKLSGRHARFSVIHTRHTCMSLNDLEHDRARPRNPLRNLSLRVHSPTDYAASPTPMTPDTSAMPTVRPDDPFIHSQPPLAPQRTRSHPDHLTHHEIPYNASELEHH